MLGYGGLGSWLLQRVSAALILVFLGLHFYVTHYTGYVDSRHVLDRLHGNIAWFLTDMALVILVGYHGFNGLRHIIADYRPPTRTMQAVNVVFVVGFLLFVGACGAHLWSFFAMA